MGTNGVSSGGFEGRRRGESERQRARAENIGTS